MENKFTENIVDTDAMKEKIDSFSGGCGESLNEYGAPIPNVITDIKANEREENEKTQNELFKKIYMDQQTAYLQKNGYMMSGKQKRFLRKKIQNEIRTGKIRLNDIGQIKISKSKFRKREK